MSILQARFYNRRQKDRYWTENKTKGKITERIIGHKVLMEVMEKTTENSRRKYTKGIDEEKLYKQKLRGKSN